MKKFKVFKFTRPGTLFYLWWPIVFYNTGSDVSSLLLVKISKVPEIPAFYIPIIFISNISWLFKLVSNAPVICNLRGRVGGYEFTALRAPCYKPHPQTGGQNFALCPFFRYRKSPWGEDPFVKTPSFPLHCGDTKKQLPRSLARLSPTLPPRWEGRSYK